MQQRYPIVGRDYFLNDDTLTVRLCVGCSSHRMRVVEKRSVSSFARSCVEFYQRLDPDPGPCPGPGPSLGLCPCPCPSPDLCLCHNLCLFHDPSPSLAPFHALYYQR